MNHWLKAIVPWGSLFALFTLLVWVGLSGPLQEIEEQSRVYGRKLALLERLNHLSTQEGNYEELLETLEGGTLEPFLYKGNQSSVQAFIQRDIRQFANEAKINISSVRAIGREDKNNALASRRLQISFSSTQREMIAFLSLIEVNQPLILIDSLSTRIEKKSTETSAAILSINMEVLGFYMTGSLEQNR
jgi:hypothetical protein